MKTQFKDYSLKYIEGLNNPIKEIIKTDNSQIISIFLEDYFIILDTKEESYYIGIYGE